MTSDKVDRFLNNRFLISVNRLEKHLDIPIGTINRAQKGVREIPEHHVKKLVNELKDYGFNQKNF
ncbi:MAG: hypothetical protein QM763_03080 [Agriterribacter sp.]